MRKYLTGLIFVFLTSCASRVCELDEIYSSAIQNCEKEPCPPAFPSTMRRIHKNVKTATIEESFFDAYRSFLYIPDAPEPKFAPVILFLHGYFDAKPERYDAMLKHYAQNGYIVIYPTYGNLLYAKSWPENAAEALKRALKYLEQESAVKPDISRLAYLGHSIGGLLAFHLAEKGLTVRPQLIVTTDAAGISTLAYPSVSLDELSRITPDTKILMMMAEETYKARFEEKDLCANDTKAKPEDNCNGFAANLRAMKRTPQIPPENKISLLIPSEKRGANLLRSDHNGAQGQCGNEAKPINAIDTWGYWRYTLLALNAVLKDEGNFAAIKQDDMRAGGKWSDGQAAKPALSLDACLLEGKCPTLKELNQ